MKRTISIFLVALLSVSIIGCDANSGPNVSTATPGTSNGESMVNSETTTTTTQESIVNPGTTTNTTQESNVNSETTTTTTQDGDTSSTGGKSRMESTTASASVSKSTETTASTTTTSKITFDTGNAIEVKVNANKRLFTSHMKLGTTQTHYRWESGSPVAAMSAAQLIKDSSSINNQHIVAFGASYLQEKQGAALNFSSLDNMVNRLKMLGGDYMLTLCSAPGWMLVSNPKDKYDPESRPKKEYFDEYAEICAQVASRYTQVNKFQVWNEMKGFWDSSRRWFDYELYTEFYNKIYDAVKNVRPDAKVGGFYMGIRGDNSAKLLGLSGLDSFDPAGDNDPLSGTGETCWKSLRYWLNNKHGADFVCIDKGIQGFRTDAELTDAQALILCQTYESVLSRLCRETNLPIVMSEYYGLRKSRARRNLAPEFQGAQFAVIYRYMLSGVKDRDYTALLWMENNNDEVCIFTDTAKVSGGKATPWYYTVNGFKQYFCEGNVIVESSSPSDKIQIMASQKKVMLINCTTDVQVVKYANNYYQLKGYEVLFVDTV